MSDRAVGIIFFVALFVVSLLVMSLLAARFVGFMPNYSNGERVGTIYKFANKGIFFKSGEGSMTLSTGPVTSAKGQILPGVLFDFSTRDAAVAGQIEEAASSNRPVVVKYRQWLLSPWAISTDVEVVSVQPVAAEAGR